ncbi:protein kinase domain-containing protein [Candidatus Uabimicrobium amorphum]|uniref:Serine/threonine protein kinase n=1 Tax=Uabimicrobium amorphum TaxID=2596890 RepID=A0A5S9F472_UABAM|nr:FHA domain-containing serine/threonine-protein kinase [Candidatus Uabimicrobium amorphum]BBM85505.1 serine/threonine protein kinase [Candidatus Uabimicrobium amorphum]
MANLTVIVGENIGTVYKLKRQENVIGRASDVSCVLRDLRASRRHSCVTFERGAYYLLDMGSHNGTYLNGQKVAGKSKLKNDDKIGIGATVLTFSGSRSDAKKQDGLASYDILKEVKQNDTGDFSIARQKIVERDVLLWRISREVLNEDPQLSKTLQRDFLLQIRTVAQILHRNILILLDFGVSTHYLYCAFECADLKYNLRKYLEDNTPTMDEIINIGLQISTGLQFAHRQNVPHLHLTDKNILIEPENKRAVITELGISKFLSSATMTNSHGSTTTGILGVSAYIAPEQASGGQVSKKSDIYSLGCALYQLVTGTPPFQTKNMYELCTKHCNEEPPPIESKRPETPKALIELIKKCMNKKSENRPDIEKVITELSLVKQLVVYEKSVYSEEGKQYLRAKFGEKRLVRWWFLGPMISIALTVIFFFVARKLH